MSDKTKQQLKIENNSSFPNNNTGFITPEKLRTFNENVIDSFLVNDYTASNDSTIADLSGSFNDFTQSYYIDSASFDSRISAVDTSSYVEQTQFDSFATQSDQRLDSIEQFTASIDDDFVSEAELAAATASLINQINTKADQTDFTSYTSSNDSRVSSIENTTSSLETKFDTLASTTASLNTFTSSAEQQLNSLEQFTASIDDDFVSEAELAAATGALENSIATKLDSSSFENYTSSTDNRLDNIEQTTASLENSVSEINTFTSSADNRLDNIENNTGSYARTDTTNQFQQTQTLEQDLIVEGNLYVSGAEVIISSSELVVGDRIIEVNANKVIGDAGLYAFDAIGDQTGSLIWNPTLDYWLAGLSGSEEKVLVSSDTASIESSINSLNDLSGSLIQTASNDFSEITLTKVDGTTQVLDTTPRQVVESIKNGNGQTLVKGTPVYASGSVGNSNLVFPASASDASTMPSVYILAQELAPDEEGLGYTHGFINGVNTSLFTAGDEIYVGENGGYTNQRPTGSNLIQKLGVVVRSDNTNGSGVIQIEGVEKLPNIQEGYIWVGDSDGVPQQVATSSIEENTDLSSLNSFTASQEDLNSTFATTGSNTFEGDQTISQNNNLLFGFNTGSLVGLQLTSFDDLDEERFGTFDTSFGIVNQNHLNQTPLSSTIALGAFTLGEQQAQSGSFIAQDIAIGEQSLTRYEEGFQNVGVGTFSLAYLTTGSRNTAIGAISLQALGFGTGTSSHEQNTAIGSFAGTNAINGGGFFTGGFGNTFLGSSTKALNAETNYEIVIGAQAEGHGENTTTLGSINNTQETYILGNTFISSSGAAGGDLDVEGDIDYNLNEGFVLVGDSNNRTYQVSTGSFGGGGSTDITALNNFTASQEDLNTTFATTGSNQFDGTQGITGSIDISSGSSIDFIGKFGNIRTQLYINQDDQFLIDGGFPIIRASVGDFQIDDFVFKSTTIMAFQGGSTGDITFNQYNNLSIDGGASITGSVDITETMNLSAQDPLPSGQIGDLAVSGSNLYFYDGAWKQVSLV